MDKFTYSVCDLGQMTRCLTASVSSSVTWKDLIGWSGLLRWKCKLFHLLRLIKHFQIMTNLWWKLLFCFLPLTFQHGLVNSSSLSLFHLLVQTISSWQHSWYPQSPGPGALRLVHLNRASSGSREWGSPPLQVCIVRRLLHQSRIQMEEALSP